MGLRQVTNLLFGICAILLLGACEPLAPSYSAQAYTNATELKARTLALVDKSGESFSKHSAAVDELLVRIDAAYEFSAGLPRNSISARQWDLLRNPDRNLVGGYMKEWKSQGKIGSFLRTEAKKGMAKAFNYIICLEANKQQAAPCSQFQ